jgi:MFS family permease
MVEAPRLLQNRDFMLLWGGQVVSTLGSMASHVIFPLLILAITDSPTAAGIAGALRFVPYLVLSLPVGALIDRWDRKRVMVVSDLGRALAVGSIPAAMALDALTLAHIYIVCFVEGSLFVFFNIAEVAALPRVVPRAQLPKPRRTTKRDTASRTSSDRRWGRSSTRPSDARCRSSWMPSRTWCRSPRSWR